MSADEKVIRLCLVLMAVTLVMLGLGALKMTHRIERLEHAIEGKQ